MPGAKRPHERGPSLSLRPYKTSRAIRDDGQYDLPEDEVVTMDENAYSGSVTPNPPRSVWEHLEMISTSGKMSRNTIDEVDGRLIFCLEPLVVPPLNFFGRLVRPLTRFDISGITAWPSSLGAIKNQFRYNLTPQLGRQLPIDVLNLTAWRAITALQNGDLPASPPLVPYLHLGFATWLEIDVFVGFPHLPPEACENGNPGRLQEVVLEAWTDRIFLPAIHDGNSRPPSSWRMSKLERFSTMFYNSAIADFPTFQISSGEVLAQIWDKIKMNSTNIAEFQDPFLIMYMDKRQRNLFPGQNPEAVFSGFEGAWTEEMDTRYIGLDQDNLKISISCDVVV